MTRRADIMRRELRSIVLEAAPGLTDCIWEPYNAPRPARPYASWRPITQPSSGARLLDDTQTLEITRQAHVQVLNVTVGQPYRLEFNNASVTSTPTGVSTLASIRDDLIAKIIADRDPVTASIFDADTLLVEGTTGADMWRVFATGEFLEATEAPGSPIDIIDLMRAPLVMTASLNVFSKGVAAEGGTELPDSSSFAHDIDVAFRKTRIVERMNRDHLAVTRIAEPVNLDGITPSQDAFESRTMVDYSIGLPYWEADFIEEIGSVEVTISTDKGTQVFTV
jgi:hypothetical protein